MTDQTQGADTSSANTTNSHEAAAGGAATGAGDQGAAAAGAAGGGVAAERPFYESFKDEGLRAHPSIVKFGSVEDLARGLAAAESRLGVPADQLLRLPTKPAGEDPEAWRGLWSKLGLPEKPEDYKIEVGPDATDQDKKVGSDFAAHMHKLGAPTPFVQGAVEWWNAQTKAAAEQRQTEFDNAAAETTASLKKEWGGAYDQRMKEIGVLLDRAGGPDLAAELNNTLIGSNPKLVKALGDIVDRMAEPGAPGGQGGDAAGSRAITPGQAKVARERLEADPVKGKALRDRDDAQHSLVVQERNRYLELEAATG